MAERVRQVQAGRGARGPRPRVENPGIIPHHRGGGFFPPLGA